MKKAASWDAAFTIELVELLGGLDGLFERLARSERRTHRRPDANLGTCTRVASGSSLSLLCLESPKPRDLDFFTALQRVDQSVIGAEEHFDCAQRLRSAEIGSVGESLDQIGLVFMRIAPHVNDAASGAGCVCAK